MIQHEKGVALVAEFLGTMLLLAIVVGSGMMGKTLGHSLGGNNDAMALLANSIATGAGLWVLITLFGKFSGAHFNPVVSLVMCWRKTLSAPMFVAYCGVQVLGAVLGVWLAHAMFEQDVLQYSTHHRTGIAQWLSECVATFGLLLTILLSGKVAHEKTPALVACYVVAAYWFTSSTSFANPAVTLARMLTDTFAGIAPQDVLGFVVAQLLGAGLAAACVFGVFVKQE